MRYRRLAAAMAVMAVATACSDSGSPVRPAPQPSAAFTITFDDSRSGVFPFAYPLLAELGLSANVAMITGAEFDVMSIPQLAVLGSAGWQVVSHTHTHPMLPALSADSARWEIRHSRQRIEELGFNSDIFVVPYFEYSPAVFTEIDDAGYAFARCCAYDPAWSPDTLMDWPIAPAARFRLTGVDVTNYGTPSTFNHGTAEGRENLRNLLSEAVRDGKFVDVVFHQITPADTADLRRTLNILVEHRNLIITYEGLRLR